MNISRIGILLDHRIEDQRYRYGLNVFEKYIGEVLSHAGIPFEWLNNTHHMLESFFDLVIVAAAPNDEVTSQTIWKYAERGGIVVSYAGVNALAKRLGFMKAAQLSMGYAHLPINLGDTRPLRFQDAVPWIQNQKQVEERDWGPGARDSNALEIAFEEWGAVASEPNGTTVGSALQRFQVGKGSIERWSIDVPGTIVGLQQGTAPIYDDGIPAPDGSAPVDEGLWKADDQVELDWKHDRLNTEQGAPYFAHPYADLWREAIVGHILQRIAQKGKYLPFIDYWPEGISKVATLSHDSDRNWDEDAIATMEILKEQGIQTTWCMMKPGYSAWIYPKIKEAGHELALHFNSNVNEGGCWSEEDFKRQAQWLQVQVIPSPVSNKNHMTRYEGWGELFQWCEACGIESDQTRGPSKQGNAGFLFGTCHPYFPIAWSNERNRFYNVLEIGFLTQDLPQFTDVGVIVPFLEEVSKVKGVAHFLFHQGRLQRFPEVRDALRLVVKEARERGFTFWTGGQINNWERERRNIRIIGISEDGNVLVNGDSSQKAVYWRPLSSEEQPQPDDVIEMKFGLMCKRLSSSKYNG